jgi:hypothetical protein
MAAINALSVRDLIALIVIYGKTIADDGHPVKPKELVEHAFGVADEFVAASEGRWAESAHAEHIERATAPRRRAHYHNNGR